MSLAQILFEISSWQLKNVKNFHNCDRNEQNLSKSISVYLLIIANKLTQFQVPSVNTFWDTLLRSFYYDFLETDMTPKWETTLTRKTTQVC